MNPDLRLAYNQAFSAERYAAYTSTLNTAVKYPADFRLAETPLFLTAHLTNELIAAATEIAEAIQTPEFKRHSDRAIPAGLAVPNEDRHTTFFQADFAICTDANGNFMPQLIELQGFPSLFAFQAVMDKAMRQCLPVPPDGLTVYFNGLDADSYAALFRNTLLGTSAPENVILLEIEPEQQKTRIDFACTEQMTGVGTVGLEHLIKRGKKLFYKKNGKEIPVERIYNRVIFDELSRKNFTAPFHLTDEIDAVWVGHPNWFFKLSKHSLPLIKSKYAPPCFYLSDLATYPDDLENYVLKPLFSFAGAGVEVEVTTPMLDGIGNSEHYILQRKVDYAPLVETPSGYAKAEVRMMFVWDDAQGGANSKPLLVNNLVRMSKGKMMGVAFNREQTWVGASIAYHPFAHHP
ncbi:MAG: hypothetical protein IAF08_10955 [Rhizobacter sp.]|nr:hypothetical protein [Chlorobiales bacterium]